MTSLLLVHSLSLSLSRTNFFKAGETANPLMQTGSHQEEHQSIHLMPQSSSHTSEIIFWCIQPSALII